MLESRIGWKLAGAFTLLILFSVLVMNFFVGLGLRDTFEKWTSVGMRTNATLVGDVLAHEIEARDIPALEAGARRLSRTLGQWITVMDMDGMVLVDSRAPERGMEGIRDDPEIRRALETGIGESTRYSEILGSGVRSVAMVVNPDTGGAAVVRLAMPVSELQARKRSIYRTVLMGGLVTVALGLLAGLIFARGLLRPITEMTEAARAISQGDFSKRVRIRGHDELAELGGAINLMTTELDQHIQRLESMDRVRTDFVANVSHELKTPLTSIKGFIETLEDGALEDEKAARRFLAIIKRNAERLSNITDDLLNLSELEAREKGLEISRFDLGELVQEVASGFEQAAKQNGQTISTTIESGSLRIRADRPKLDQMVVNLLDNALKYSGKGGEVRLYVGRGKDKLLVRVSDNGIGIPEEHRSRIFERFYRVDKARSREVGGTGLGLAIVKHAVALHGGDIEVDSQPDRGTSITVTLPLK